MRQKNGCPWLTYAVSEGYAASTTGLEANNEEKDE